MTLLAKDKAGASDTCVAPHTFGGQAVIEGVMMRGRNSWGVAVRRPSGGIARVSYPLDPPGSRHKLLRIPIVRGVMALYDSLSLGIKALGISANIGLEDSGKPETEAAQSSEAAVPAGGIASAVEGTVAPAVVESATGAAEPVSAAVESAANAAESVPAEEKPADEGPPAFGFKELAVTVTISMAMAVGLFVVIPLVVVKQFEETFANPFVFNLVEGLIRIAIFLLYIVGISLIPDLRRVFQYHGAEHKVIHAYEACGRPDMDEAGRYPTLHPRCGTGFLLLVMVIAVFLFAVVGKPSLPLLVLSRIIGIPVIVGISYEIGIKWAGRHPNGFFARILLWPGIQLQRLTTREPTPDQLEVAAAALEEVMALDESLRTAEETAPATT